MKSSKKNTVKQDYGFTKYRPLDELLYPRAIESYKRFYVRARFIVYLDYYPSGDIRGFMLIHNDQATVIEKLPFQTMYNRVMLWCDQNENNINFKIIAKCN